MNYYSALPTSDNNNQQPRTTASSESESRETENTTEEIEQITENNIKNMNNLAEDRENLLGSSSSSQSFSSHPHSQPQSSSTFPQPQTNNTNLYSTTTFQHHPLSAPISSSQSQAQSPSKSLATAIRPKDGVFANLSAKPNISDKSDLPTYAQVAASIKPPTYTETIIISPYTTDSNQANHFNIPSHPNHVDFGDGVMVGSWWAFLFYCTVSSFFNLVGFMMTWILADSHAGRYGSLAGLGLTLMTRGAGLQQPSGGGHGRKVGGGNETDDQISFIFLIIGSALFISSIVFYQRTRLQAKQYIDSQRQNIVSSIQSTAINNSTGNQLNSVGSGNISSSQDSVSSTSTTPSDSPVTSV